MTPAARLLIVGLILLALLLATVPQPVQAAMTSNEFEACLLTKINSSRASAGAPALTMATDLDPQVRDWSEWMRHNTFRHMTSSEPNPILPGGTTTWGENIAWTSNTADSACNQVHTQADELPGAPGEHPRPVLPLGRAGSVRRQQWMVGDRALLLLELLLPHCEGTFCDDDYSIFQNDIELVAAADITKGCNPPANDHFCPDDYVTRGAMAVFLARALNL